VEGRSQIYGLRSPNLNLHFDPGTQSVDDRHEPVDREPVEVGIPNAREIRGRHPGATMGHPHSHAFTVKHPDNFSSQERFAVLDVGVFMPEVAEDIPASMLRQQIFHRSDIVIFDNEPSILWVCQ